MINIGRTPKDKREIRKQRRAKKAQRAQEAELREQRREQIKRERKRSLYAKQKQAGKFGVITMIVAVVYCILFAVFVRALVTADMLPSNYTYGILAVLSLISMLLFPTLFFSYFKKSRKTGALAIAGVLMLCYLIGIVNIGGTVSFFSTVTNITKETEDYYVVVNEDSSFQKLSDLKGHTVASPNYEIGLYPEARNQVRTEMEVDFHMVADLKELGDGLRDDSYSAILTSAGQYDALCDSDKDFKKGTRIIETYTLEKESEDLSKNVDVTKDSFNIYISGIDVSGSIDVTSRSDVNMIVTVNPQTGNILLTSIPRDYLIQLPSFANANDKLTHTGIYGIKESIGAIENLLGIDINYYLKVNYTTVKKFVNAIGGIDVNSEFAFYTHGMAAEYYFEEGPNHLDGDMALAFARERKSFDDGDVQRNKNQQLVLEAIIKKATSSSTILTKYSSILKACKKYMQLNMTEQEIRKLVKYQLTKNPSWKIAKQNLTGYDDQTQVYSSGSYYVYVMSPDENALAKCVDKMIEIKDGKAPEEEKEKE